MKIQHIYTVIREFEIDPSELAEEKDCFKGIKDEAGEYLYSGLTMRDSTETINVKMKVIHNGGSWVVGQRQRPDRVGQMLLKK